MLTTAENFAAAHVLTEWPEEFTYDELLTALSEQHPDVIVWQPFEDLLPEDVIDHIEALRADFLNTVAAMTEDLCQAIEDGDQQAIADRMLALREQVTG
jgi:hypothetical protein